MTLSLYMDITLAVLLVIAIAYCWRLEGRLKALRSGKDGMLAATAELAQTIAQAQETVASLRQSADEAGQKLQSRIDEARTMTPRTTEPQPSVQGAGLRRRTTY